MGPLPRVKVRPWDEDAHQELCSRARRPLGGSPVSQARAGKAPHPRSERCRRSPSSFPRPFERPRGKKFPGPICGAPLLPGSPSLPIGGRLGPPPVRPSSGPVPGPAVTERERLGSVSSSREPEKLYRPVQTSGTEENDAANESASVPEEGSRMR